MFVRASAELASFFVAVERVQEYGNLPPEVRN